MRVSKCGAAYTYRDITMDERTVYSTMCTSFVIRIISSQPDEWRHFNQESRIATNTKKNRMKKEWVFLLSETLHRGGRPLLSLPLTVTSSTLLFFLNF